MLKRGDEEKGMKAWERIKTDIKNKEKIREGKNTNKNQNKTEK